MKLWPRVILKYKTSYGYHRSDSSTTTIEHSRCLSSSRYPRIPWQGVSRWLLRNDLTYSLNWEFYSELPLGREQNPRKCVPNGMTRSQSCMTSRLLLLCQFPLSTTLGLLLGGLQIKITERSMQPLEREHGLHSMALPHPRIWHELSSDALTTPTRSKR